MPDHAPERGEGWIVNIATVIADPAGPGVKRGAQFARASTYAPSKASLNLLTQTLAAELGPSGIAVNAVAPEMAVATEGATAVMDLPPRAGSAVRSAGSGVALVRNL